MRISWTVHGGCELDEHDMEQLYIEGVDIRDGAAVANALDVDFADGKIDVHTYDLPAWPPSGPPRPHAHILANGVVLFGIIVADGAPPAEPPATDFTLSDGTTFRGVIRLDPTQATLL